MAQKVIVQELTIVIAAKNHNPRILTPDFLKYSGILPTDWELARAPISTDQFSQVTFTNGVSIVAEPQRIVFLEAIENKTNASVLVPAIARKYVETLPNMEYQAMGLNPRGFVTFEKPPDAAHKYISERLLSPSACLEFGHAPMRATINYAYTLERGQFNLSVNEAALRLQDETTTPIVLFNGNFSYELAGNTGLERLLNLKHAIDNWQVDLEIYTDIINTKFLTASAATPLVVPDLFAMSPAAWASLTTTDITASNIRTASAT